FTNGLTSGSSDMEPIDLNVSLCVRARCADHSTSVSALARHKAKASAPKVYVFPACRGMETTAPPMPHAYNQLSRFPSTAVSRPLGHGARGTSIRTRRRATDAHAALSLPSGSSNGRATSDSLDPECRALGGAAVSIAHPRRCAEVL